MVSRRPPNTVKTAHSAPIPGPNSPLENTPHKARVKRDGLMATAITTVPVSAQGSGAAALDGAQYFQMRPPQPGSVVLDEALALRADDVGHLEGGPAHFLCSFRERFTWSGLDNSTLSSGVPAACRWR